MTSTAVRSLYKELSKVASSFKDKNFREYFVRITRDDFDRFSQNPSGEAAFLKKQEENLEVLKRQTCIQNMYFSESFSVRR
jgi:hypothetical protein